MSSLAQEFKSLKLGTGDPKSSSESTGFAFDFAPEVLDESWIDDQEEKNDGEKKKKKKKPKKKGGASAGNETEVASVVESSVIKKEVPLQQLGTIEIKPSSGSDKVGDNKTTVVSVSSVVDTNAADEGMTLVVSKAEATKTKAKKNNSKATSAVPQDAKAKANKKSSNKKGGNAKKVEEEDDEDWFCPQPQPDPETLKPKPKGGKGKGKGKVAELETGKVDERSTFTLRSKKDPSLDEKTRRLRKFGEGKNLVRQGAPKVRDPKWLERPPGLDIDIPAAAVAATATALMPKLKPKEPELHSSPFSFGFL